MLKYYIAFDILNFTIKRNNSTFLIKYIFNSMDLSFLTYHEHNFNYVNTIKNNRNWNKQKTRKFYIFYSFIVLCVVIIIQRISISI